MIKIIIITENQFKTLIENIINEQEYNVFEDEHAFVLLNYLLNTEEDEEYGLSNIELKHTFDNGIRAYRVGSGSSLRSYRIGIDDGSLKWSFTDMKSTNGGFKSSSFTNLVGKYIKYNNAKSF